MDIARFLAADPIIQVHAVAAIAALGLGLSLYGTVKGGRLHRTMGITTAVLLAVVVVTAYFIRVGPDDSFSWIHGFIPLTTIGLATLWMATAKGDFKRHKQAARGLIFGALLIPGLFTLMPGRLMHQVVFGA